MKGRARCVVLAILAGSALASCSSSNPAPAPAGPGAHTPASTPAPTPLPQPTVRNTSSSPSEATPSPSTALTTPTPYPPGFSPDNAWPYSGLFFERTPAGIMTTCRSAADALGFAVACPVSVLYGTQACSACVNGTAFSLTADFPAPSDYLGPSGAHGLGQFVMLASRSPVASACTQAQEWGTVHASDGFDQHLLDCSHGAAASWRTNGINYLVRVDGDDGRNRGIAKLLANDATLIGP
jgi:hypothetical protein